MQEASRDLAPVGFTTLPFSLHFYVYLSFLHPAFSFFLPFFFSSLTLTSRRPLLGPSAHSLLLPLHLRQV